MEVSGCPDGAAVSAFKAEFVLPAAPDPNAERERDRRSRRAGENDGKQTKVHRSGLDPPPELRTSWPLEGSSNCQELDRRCASFRWRAQAARAITFGYRLEGAGFHCKRK
jgi:hypothetical protein